MQLVQLQESLPGLEEAGYALYAVSYDRVARLARFAAAHGITYPLLADYGSTWIRRLGLLNDRVQEEHGRYGIQPQRSHEGVAHPGVFALDGAGVVRAARFYESYRERDTAATLLEELLDLALPRPSPSPAAGDGPVAVRAWLDRPAWSWYQRNRLHVALDVRAGWHVYVDPVPEGYEPLRVDVSAPPGVALGARQVPPGRPHRVEGLPERFQVADGPVEVTVPFTVVRERGSGAFPLGVAVTYQACDDRTCAPPRTERLDLLVDEAPAVE